MGRSGQLELEFRRDRNKRTYLHRQFAAYPFHICRPHYFAGDPPGLATLYVQSLAGGIYEGDRLAITAAFSPRAQAHLTSQASTIVHSMVDDHASHATTITAAANSLVEYMPDPLILFPAAQLTTTLTVDVHPTAVVLLAEAVLFHDPAGAGRPFSRLSSKTVVRGPDKTVLACDRFVATGADVAAGVPGITGRYRALGSAFLIAPEPLAQGCVAPLRHLLDSSTGLYGGVSNLPNGCGIWARLLAGEAHVLRAAMDAAWSIVRRAALGREPPPRRK